MNYKKVLITGGAGFVGSNIAVLLKENYPKLNITVIDNLSRRGSEMNLSRLKKMGIEFLWGDVRTEKDLSVSTDLIIECSAEPSVMAGVFGSPAYLIDTNLMGAVNCFELARKNKADVVFLSTSRVYPIEALNSLSYKTLKMRYQWEDLDGPGISSNGVSEDFPLTGTRSLYGATKLSAELLLLEYLQTYNLKGIINRCGVISGPWQMGKVDQGVVMLWLASHFFKKKLSYVGYDGLGKQVRDVLHVYDLFDLLLYQLENIDQLSGNTFNVGGGVDNSASLLELTKFCQEVTGNTIKIDSVPQTRIGDLRIYITDNKKVSNITGWKPTRDVAVVLSDIFSWVKENEKDLRNIF